jgi:hypothetical protein
MLKQIREQIDLFKNLNESLKNSNEENANSGVVDAVFFCDHGCGHGSAEKDLLRQKRKRFFLKKPGIWVFISKEIKIYG